MKETTSTTICAISIVLASQSDMLYFFLFAVMPIMPIRNDLDEQCPSLQRSLVKEHVSIETYSTKGWRLALETRGSQDEW